MSVKSPEFTDEGIREWTSFFVIFRLRVEVASNILAILNQVGETARGLDAYHNFWITNEILELS